MLHSLNNLEEYERENRFSAKRREPGEYCSVIVVYGYFRKGIFNNGKKWYWMLEGEEVFCKIVRNRYNQITEFIPCYLTNTTIKYGRGMDPEDCIII